MSRRKLIILGVALLGVAVGVAVSLLWPGAPGDRAHDGSHGPVLLAAIVPCWSAAFISLRRRRRRCGTDEA